MKQQRMKNTNKGITLIALVITIIVMLILVAVTISMAVNGGLFEYAGKAVSETNNALKAEHELGSGKVTIDNTVYNSIDEYIETKGNTQEAENSLVSLYKKGEIEVGDYVDYNPVGVAAVNPDNPENVEGVEVGALTGYTEEAQSLSYEDLSWRVLGYDKTKNELLLISATPTTETLSFYGYVGYNNYKDVLETICNKLYSNIGIGAKARCITMEDIDTYLGGSSFDKTNFEGGSTKNGGYGYNEPSVSSRFDVDESGKLIRKLEGEGRVTLNLTSNAYSYDIDEVITDTMKLDILLGSNLDKSFYYYISEYGLNVSNYSPVGGIADWGGFQVSDKSIRLGAFAHSTSLGSGYEVYNYSCLRPIVALSNKVTLEQVQIISSPESYDWNDPLGIYAPSSEK